MSWVGKSLRRKEDERLIRGNGLFADDELGEGMLHLYVLRSPYAHARIRGIDTAAAESLPGVACVLTGADMVAEGEILMDDGTLRNKFDSLRERLRELGSRKVSLPDGTYYWLLRPGLRFGDVIEL